MGSFPGLFFFCQKDHPPALPLNVDRKEVLVIGKGKLPVLTSVLLPMPGWFGSDWSDWLMDLTEAACLGCGDDNELRDSHLQALSLCLGYPVQRGELVAEALKARLGNGRGGRFPVFSVGLGATRLVNHGVDLANLPDNRPLRVRYQGDLPVTPANILGMVFDPGDCRLLG